MKISTKGRYGLRAILDLAINSHGEHVSLINIADRQEISKNYLEQVFSTLRKAGIVNSIKGAQGGYILAAEADTILIGDILRVLEGSLSVIGENPDTDINKIERCIQTNIWDQMDKKINEVIDSLTLQDLIDDYKKNDDVIMYYI